MLTQKMLPGVAAQPWLITTADWRRWLTFSNEVTFAASISTLWVVLYNNAFWQKTVAAMWHPGWRPTLFVLALLGLAVTLHATLILLIPRRALRPTVSVLFMIAALSSYFCNTYGVVLNKDMVRNMLQTDAAEVGGLLSGGMVLYFLVMGILPTLMLGQVSIPIEARRVRLRRRMAFLAAAWLVCIIGMFASSSSYAVFFREYKPLRSMLVPAAPLSSAIGVMTSHHPTKTRRELIDPAGRAYTVAARSTRPRVIFMVVGETARAAEFSLGGYRRRTNPQLADVAELTYYDHASSCGTATAISVPCMFSSFERGSFEVGEADQYLNLLDTLSAAQVDVEWRDNNAGCKGVCARVRTITYPSQGHPELCPESYCYDEIMLRGLSLQLQTVSRDTLIVFHQIGSHGPAYAERYPPNFEVFKPACHSHELHRCSAEEVRNAYDNTIAYTDHFLARAIELLQAAQNVDGMLVYASDHGESLGERGIYLHGMPYSFAPKEQTSVPMLLWATPSMRSRMALDSGCLQQYRHDAVSHDNLYHTLLGAFGLRNQAYRAALDLLSACSKAGTDRA